MSFEFKLEHHRYWAMDRLHHPHNRDCHIDSLTQTDMALHLNLSLVELKLVEFQSQAQH